ncbi:phosphatidylinositol-3-phosphatase SAC1-like [Corticium candelabrum]|uniref:phosphatidylinositol-3-phosphatase SAC1-like n=1 Tax=Corticium candelabrum TaxID=121492 RepID=UPI002E26950C|nr:phosphatidylinositol-3-phosphatase SAC1-like [Corticium candelabrum]
MSVHDSLRLCTTSEIFYVVPSDGSGVLEIDRASGQLRVVRNANAVPPSATIRQIYGIIGIIRLIAGPYLVVITGREKVGTIEQHDVWRVTSTDVIAFARSVRHLSEIQDRHNRTYVNMVQTVFQTFGFYYSATYDVTHTLQRLENTTPEFKLMHLNERADQRFVWNRHLLQDLAAQPELHQFTLPIMHGFVSINRSVVNQKEFQFILISRRSCYRAGVRYYMRGVDSDGHAANSVETEQIVVYQDARTSFVQTRGSIPVHWSQRPNLSYKPHPKIGKLSTPTVGCQRHFDSQIALYGRQIAVNLINQKGVEKPVGDEFRRQVDAMDNLMVTYHAFDFHHECKHMQWHRLSILLGQLADERKKQKYFLVDQKGDAIYLQDGILRTNCMDSLDRTNVVQGIFAKASLQEQLEWFGILSVGEQVEQHRGFEFLYKNVWADNGDALAMQYTGTGALKSDFTRTGKRSITGSLQDGYKSTVRYFQNNFTDGFRQDAIDLVLGNYVVDPNEGIHSPLNERQGWKLAVVPLVLLFGFSMLIISLLIPATEWIWQLIYVLFWGVAVFITMRVAVYYGYELVDSPRLVQTADQGKNS